ncbi:No apical meristem (NAM) protein [Corchorus olitorius]|uniref:No apical meristem (NAM) protein n=1 Tax=Corchorus olitorius TaxID=93759 RepID=A0A1R3IW72_9ROSI|nr:No apical meristem (NAM) protein [Corchorus olitorius]
MFPALTGFRFNPTDEELLEILNQKVVSGNVAPAFDFIVERNIYESEPQDLQWSESVGLNSNERYYLCKRESDSREVVGRGWWKATSHVKTISSANNAGVMGFKRPLTFHRFKDNQRNRKDAIKTDWIMHEYGLHSIQSDWRLCKIKYKGKEKHKEEETIMENSDAAAGGSSSSINQEQPLPLNSSESEYPSSSLINMQPLPSYYQHFPDQLWSNWDINWH